MVSFLSSWAEQIVIAIVIASIIEMILPDNKNKKYIKMVIGIYILFNIISPFINTQDLFSLDGFSVEAFTGTNQTTNEVVNQTSMDERIQQLYVDELEKNIQEKVEEEGYKVNKCSVDAVLYGDEETQGINSIDLNVSKSDEQDTEKSSDSTIETIDKVEIKVGLSKYFSNDDTESQTVSNDEINNLKKVLSDYYEVDTSKINIYTE